MLSKSSWKRKVKSSVLKKNYAEILEMSKKYKKTNHDELKNEEVGLKQYMKNLSLPDARLKFALRSRMTRFIQMNYKGNPAYKSNGWKCNHCKLPDTQEHVMQCDLYKSLRKNVNFDSDKELVDYFRNVLKLRKENS